MGHMITEHLKSLPTKLETYKTSCTSPFWHQWAPDPEPVCCLQQSDRSSTFPLEVSLPDSCGPPPLGRWDTLDFLSLWQIPEATEGVICLGHGFRGFIPWSARFLVSQPLERQHITSEGCGEVKTLTSWQEAGQNGAGDKKSPPGHIPSNLLQSHHRVEFAAPPKLSASVHEGHFIVEP